MAELASGAVTALLGVIRNEQRLLSGVKGDVQFIKEEMESMSSFLMHLARTSPPGDEHDEQVQTWMRQVRLLAQDCNNCIDLYLYRGNPDIHLARSGLRRYLWLVPWFVQKMFAQHFAAIQLRELKDRAREVGARRLRYGVEVPGKATAGQSSSAPALQGGDEEEDDDDNLVVAAMATQRPGRRGAVFEPPTLDDYFHGKLVDWMNKVKEGKTGAVELQRSIPSIAVVTPDTETNAARALARQALQLAEDQHFECKVLVDVPAMHYSYRTVQAEDILYYIMLELERAEKGKGGEEELQDSNNDWRAAYKRRRRILWSKWDLIQVIETNIGKMKVDDKIEKIKGEVQQLKGHSVQLDQERTNVQLDQEAIADLLLRLALVDEPVYVSDTWCKEIIEEASKKLKVHMEAVEEEEKEDLKQTVSKICLDVSKYEGILSEVFQTASNNKHLQGQEQETNTTMLGEDQMKEIIDKVKLEILREVFQGTSTSKPLQAQEQSTKATTSTLSEEPFKETKMTHEAKPETLQQLQENKPDTTRATDKLTEGHRITDASIDQTIRKIEKIRQMIRKQMRIKWMVEEIKKDHLKGKKVLMILKIDQNYTFKWEETKTALSQLGCVAGAAVVTASKNTQWAKQYCNPPGEPLDCSLVGLYHDTVLELTSQQTSGGSNYDTQIFRNILDKCGSHEFSMKIFTHALYSNPKRNNEELCKLYNTLQDSPKSLDNAAKKTDNIAKKMFKFSYNDLPKEYKSCLLYLAIFPPGLKIRRSTLVGRWVAEGLVTTDDWRWSSSVRKAERCFRVLLDRWLVYPVDYGATGKVKSCIVGDLVHQFITKVAKKQHIVETRLSLHLARHFSIFNDLHLRGSDTIKTFFKHITEWSQLSQLKVLDLEGCRCFGNHHRYLKDICNTILLLKYLSLRRTDITHLPSEINNLHELEVLDIRQTKVPGFETRNVMLLKLKRLLAGKNDLGSKQDRNEEFSNVWIPEKIEKMVNMEVLSNVKAPSSRDLKDIRKLWQLRKLGVVIEDKDSHLNSLFRTISDLHECLMSLSITLPTIKLDGTHSIGVFPEDMRSRLKYSLKLLESLSINGTTQRGDLLGFLSTHVDSNKLAKVTLCRTFLKKENWEVLAKQLPELQCLRFQHIECTESMLIFKKDEFKHLKYLLVEGSNLGGIIFENDGDARELTKMVLSSTNIAYICGVDGLLKLEELELNNNCCGRLISSFDDAKQIARLTLRGTLLEQVDLQILAKKPNIRCLVLLEGSCGLSQITFNKDEFPKLNLLLIDCSHITKIIFTSGSVPKLEKIIWSSFTSLLGIEELPRLKELEFKGDRVPDELKEAIRKRKDQPKLKHIEPKLEDQASEQVDGDDDTRFSFWSKIKI